MSVLGWKISFLNICIVQVLGEVQESVKTGLWAGDCFIYTNAVNRLNYYVGGEIVTISHLDRSVSLRPHGIANVEILVNI